MICPELNTGFLNTSTSAVIDPEFDPGHKSVLSHSSFLFQPVLVEHLYYVYIKLDQPRILIAPVFYNPLSMALHLTKKCYQLTPNGVLTAHVCVFCYNKYMQDSSSGVPLGSYTFVWNLWLGGF